MSTMSHGRCCLSCKFDRCVVVSVVSIVSMVLVVSVVSSVALLSNQTWFLTVVDRHYDGTPWI